MRGTKLFPFVAAYPAKTATTILGYNYATHSVVFECSIHCNFDVFRDSLLLLKYEETIPNVLLNKHIVTSLLSRSRDNIVWSIREKNGCKQFILTIELNFVIVTTSEISRFSNDIINSVSIYGSTALCWALAAFSRSWSFTESVGLLGRRDQPVARPLPAPRTAQTQNKRTQTTMPQVGFEPTIPVFERAKTVYALDRAATVIGYEFSWWLRNRCYQISLAYIYICICPISVFFFKIL
jgi:hypothetical protein